MTSAQNVRVNGLENAAVIRGSTVFNASIATKSGTRGAKVGPEIPLYHDANEQGRAQVYLARNANNVLLWVVLYVGAAGTYDITFNMVDVEAVFLRLP